jgi:hypothetical protein
MKFFIPLGRDEARERRVYHGIRRSLTDALGTRFTVQEICSLHYQHDGQEFDLDVGQPHPLNGETIMVILCGNPCTHYYVCTRTRGVSEGQPFLVDAQEVLSVIEFGMT